MIKKIFSLFFLLALPIFAAHFGQELRSPNDILKDITKNSNKATLYGELGDSYLQQGKNQKAEKAFQQALTLDSSFAESYYGLGLLAYKKKNYHKAKENLQIAVALRGTSTSYLSLLGLTYMKLHLWKKAIDVLNSGVMIKGEKAGFFYSLLGRCYDQTHNYTKSAECILKQFPSRPWDDTIYVEAAKKYYKAGKTELGNKYKKKAGSAWNEYNTLTKQYADNAGWSAYQKQDYDEAIKNFQKEISAYPKNVNNYWGIGLAYLKMQNYYKAQDSFMKALKLNSNLPKIYNKLGYIALKEGNEKQAINYYTHALSIDPKDNYTLYDLAQLYIKKSQLEKSFYYLKKLTKSNPDKATYWATEAYVASRLNKTKIVFDAYMAAYKNSRTEKARKKYIKKAVTTGLNLGSQKPKMKKKIAYELLSIIPPQNDNYPLLKKWIGK